jgi:prolyl oligopeptidase
MKTTARERAARVRYLSAFALFALVLSLLAVAPFVSRAAIDRSDDTKKDPKIVYPESKKVEVVEDYFGTKVADPYRWLEDDRTPEVQSWIEAQNKVTFAYLDKIPYR